MSSPSQIFIQSMFTQKELMSTKRAEASRIMGLVNNLSLEDIKVVSQYQFFLENTGYIPKKEMFTPSNLTRTKEHIPEINGNFYFKPSETFKGSMPGWVFSTSSEGTGYYLDMK
jgi:hypothetical protein